MIPENSLANPLPFPSLENCVGDCSFDAAFEASYYMNAIPLAASRCSPERSSSGDLN